MKASDLKIGDTIEMSYGAMYPAGIIIITGIEMKPGVTTDGGVVVTESRAIVTGMRIDGDTAEDFSMDADREGDVKSIGSFKLISREDAMIKAGIAA